MSKSDCIMMQSASEAWPWPSGNVWMWWQQQRRPAERQLERQVPHHSERVEIAARDDVRVLFVEGEGGGLVEDDGLAQRVDPLRIVFVRDVDEELAAGREHHGEVGVDGGDGDSAGPGDDVAGKLGTRRVFDCEARRVSRGDEGVLARERERRRSLDLFLSWKDPTCFGFSLSSVSTMTNSVVLESTSTVLPSADDSTKRAPYRLGSVKLLTMRGSARVETSTTRSIRFSPGSPPTTAKRNSPPGYAMSCTSGGIAW